MRLFTLGDRGLIVVSGGDRTRWLDGMLTNDVAGLGEGPERSGCYALLLTRQGRIVSDLHVLLRGEELWLELAAAAVAPVLESLEKLLVADDVRLKDHSQATARLALEGAGAAELLCPSLQDDACGEVELAGARVVVAAYGMAEGAARARQLLVPAEAAAAVAGALREAGAEASGPELLERLRIEAGVPRFGSELGPDVLPAEARLDRAISTSKGCYTGQEVVERMRSRGQVGHLLVGLRFDAEPPPPGSELRERSGGDTGRAASASDLPSAESAPGNGRRVGEITSATRSPREGAIALGFVRRRHAEPGTLLDCLGRPARVVSLPFRSSA